MINGIEKVAKVTTIPGYNAVNSSPAISYHKEELAIGKQLREKKTFNYSNFERKVTPV